jgi:hypothetical protein
VLRGEPSGGTGSRVRAEKKRAKEAGGGGGGGNMLGLVSESPSATGILGLEKCKNWVPRACPPYRWENMSAPYDSRTCPVRFKG